MANDEPNGRITTREFYEKLQQFEDKADARAEKLDTRLRRVEIALAVIAVLTPVQLLKLLGGPDAPQVAMDIAQRVFS